MLYKILVKVLANRLKVILLGIISFSQYAFVSGRMITNNVIITFDLIYHIKRKTRVKKGKVALKIDISKAYDRVD